MTASRGVSSFAALVFACLVMALTVFAPRADASLDTVTGGDAVLLANLDTLATMNSDGIVVSPIAPSAIIAQQGTAGFSFPVTGGTVESDTLLGTINLDGGFSMQKYVDGEATVLDVTDPQIFGGNTWLANLFGGIPAPAADLANATHDKNPCTERITYDADATVGPANALVLNTYFNSSVFTNGMVLGHLHAEVETTTHPVGDLVAGKSLLLTDGTKKKMTMITQAMTIGTGAADPVANGGEVRLCNKDFDVTYPLPASGWTRKGTLSTPKSYKFKSKTGPIRSVELKGGKQIKVIGQGALGHSLASNPNPLDIVVQTGERKYCIRYGGKTAYIPGKIFKSKNSLPPDNCPIDAP